MSQTVFPQLQAIEAELISQESELSAQLTSVREKLTGIRAVMPMFSAIPSSVSEPSSEVQAAPAQLELPEPKATEAKTSEASEASEIKETKETKPKKVAVKKVAEKKQGAVKKSPPKKVDGRAASWQKYARPGVKNQSMPDAVKLILETQPEKDFKIADVMEALFKEEMPKSQYLKARNRISNVLSGGVRAGDWYKGDRGTYRMTAA